MGVKVDEVDCRECLEEEIYMDVKEESSLYKIGAQCVSCHHDYGVIDRIPRNRVSHRDEVYEHGESSIKELLE